jgi:hypothetical protein
MCLLGEEDYRHVPHFDIKLHPKNAWKNLGKPIGTPKMRKPFMTKMQS